MSLRGSSTIDFRLIASGLLLAMLILVVAYADSRRQVRVAFTVQASTAGRLQVFHDAEGGFSEAGSQSFGLQSGEAVEEMLRINGRDAAWLRIDPPPGVTTTLCDLRIGRSGSRGQYEILLVDELSLADEHACLKLQPDQSARDPKLILRFVDRSARKIERAGTWQAVFYATLPVLLVSLWWIYRFYRRLREWLSAIPTIPGFRTLYRNAHWVCAALMLLLGAAYVFITPPGAVADEEAHLAKIVRLSEGMPFGGSGSEPLPDTRKMYGPFWGYSHNKTAFTGEELSAQLSKKLACDATSTTLPRGADGYFPHQYLLPGAAFKASCAMGATFGFFLYSARMLNLLLSIVFVVLALRYAVRGKWALFAIALLPMSLFQMGSLSADSLTISLSIAWLGLVSGIAGDKVTPTRIMPMLWALSLAIAFLKPGTAWILICLAFCKPAFDRAGHSFGAAMLKFVALPWVIHAAWTLLAAKGAGALAGVDAVANAHSLSAEPSIFMHAWFNTFFSDRVLSLGKMLIGVLGWLDVYLSPWVYPAGGLALLATLWTNEDSMPRMPYWIPPLALVLAAGSMAMIALPLFIYWSPVELGFIQGLQGRYFIATAAFALVWCSFRSTPPIRALLVSVILVLIVVINLDALHVLHRAYFVTGRM
jgi:hypothetical protein